MSAPHPRERERGFFYRAVQVVFMETNTAEARAAVRIMSMEMGS
jgi:hypothetical protein